MIPEKTPEQRGRELYEAQQGRERMQRANDTIKTMQPSEKESLYNKAQAESKAEWPECVPLSTDTLETLTQTRMAHILMRKESQPKKPKLVAQAKPEPIPYDDDVGF